MRLRRPAFTLYTLHPTLYTLHSTHNMNLILGSQSPRRRELMAGLDIPFSCITIDADESFPADLQAGDIPLYISRAKARA